MRVRWVPTAVGAVALGAVWCLQVGLSAPAAAACASSRTTIGSVSLAPSGTSAPVGTPHTLTATVLGPAGNGSPAPLAGVCVSFEQGSGPSTGWPRTATTAADGRAQVTFTSAATGSEVLFAQAYGSQTVTSNRVTHTWTARPSPSPTRTRRPTPSPTAVTSAGPSRPPTPTPSSAPPGSAPPSASASPSTRPSPSALPTPRAGSVPSTAQGGPPTPARAPVLVLDHPSALPGGTAQVAGHGCLPGAAVTVTIGGRPAGATTADPSGAFRTPLQVPDLPVGRSPVQVRCGALSAVVPLDLVVASAGIGAGTAAVASSVLLFFLLLAAVLVFRDNGPAGRRARRDETDE